MKTSFIVVALAASLTASQANTHIPPAPGCAVECAASIGDNAPVDLKDVCEDKAKQNNLFQCLITSCPSDVYGPAAAYIIMTCSNLGASIGPLHPVKVQHIKVAKHQFIPTAPGPVVYGPPIPAPTDHNTGTVSIDLDFSVALDCNAGSDGVVTLSLPAPPPSATTPAPGPDDGNGPKGNGDGDDDPASSPSPDSPDGKPQEPTKVDSSGPCPSDSGSSSYTPTDQGPDQGRPPSQNTDPNHGQGDHIVTTPPVVTSQAPDSQGPPAASTPCSTSCEQTNGGGTVDSHPDPTASSRFVEAHSPTNGDGESEMPTSGIPDSVPSSPGPITPSALPSSTCSDSDGNETPANSSPSGEATSINRPSPPAPPTVLPITTSTTCEQPASSSQTTPPAYSPQGDPQGDPNNSPPPVYASPSAGNSSPPAATGPSPSTSAINTNNPDSDGTASSQHGAPNSSLALPPYSPDNSSPQTPDPANQNDSATNKPTDSTIWPTGTTSCTSSTKNPKGDDGPSSTSCLSEIATKQTFVTAHHPSITSSPFNEASSFDTTLNADKPDALWGVSPNEPDADGLVMVRIIRPVDDGTETTMTVWETTPMATVVPGDFASNSHHDRDERGFGFHADVINGWVLDSAVAKDNDNDQVKSIDSLSSLGFISSGPTMTTFVRSENTAIDVVSSPETVVTSGAPRLPAFIYRLPLLCITLVITGLLVI